VNTLTPPLTPEADKTKPVSGHRVLIADDDAVSRRVLQVQLQRWGYEVTALDNGTQAWIALQKEDAPRMAILDWVMPGVDGPELCRRIRGLDRNNYFYLLLLTARDSKQDIVAGLEAGADDYLTKPFHPDELRARVRVGKRILELQEALIQAHESLKYEAAHDRLTGIWGRAAIVDLLQREARRSLRGGRPLGVIMADVDHFKKINDAYGHLVGDSVLQEVARRLTQSVRAYDYVGRYGGEEFLMVLTECAPPDLAITAERIRRAVAEQDVTTDFGAVRVTISLGLAPLQIEPLGTLNVEKLLRSADAALYRAKNNGRNRVESA
jgi:two-component system, cell cycle response regulator